MTTHTIEIPRASWRRELAAFSAAHQDWLISVEIVSRDFGTQPSFDGLPLVGVTYEPLDHGAIVVAAGRSAHAHVTHVVRGPTHMRIVPTETGAEAALEIDATDGTRTVVRLRAAALRDTADSVAGWP